MLVAVISVLLLGAALATEDKKEDLKKPETNTAPQHDGGNGPHHEPVGYGHPPINDYDSNRGYGAHGQSGYGLNAVHGRYEHELHGLRDYGSHRNLGVQGARVGYGDGFKDVGHYSRNKSDGYEKAYTYDKMSSFQNASGSHGLYDAQHGLNDYGGHRNLGIYGKHDGAVYDTKDLYGHQGYSKYDYLGAHGGLRSSVYDHRGLDYGLYGYGGLNYDGYGQRVLGYSAYHPEGLGYGGYGHEVLGYGGYDRGLLDYDGYGHGGLDYDRYGQEVLNYGGHGHRILRNSGYGRRRLGYGRVGYRIANTN